MFAGRNSIGRNRIFTHLSSSFDECEGARLFNGPSNTLVDSPFVYSSTRILFALVHGLACNSMPTILFSFPFRFYEFGDSTITCLKFSIENPNRLAVGFYNGEILIIDISSKSLRIVFQKSKQSALETDGILDLFWIIRVENQFLRLDQYECLVSTANTFITL